MYPSVGLHQPRVGVRLWSVFCVGARHRGPFPRCRTEGPIRDLSKAVGEKGGPVGWGARWDRRGEPRGVERDEEPETGGGGRRSGEGGGGAHRGFGH